MIIKKMKNIFILLLAAVMLFSLTACGKKENTAPENTPDPAMLTVSSSEENKAAITAAAAEQSENPAGEIKTDAASAAEATEQAEPEAVNRSAELPAEKNEKLLKLELLDTQLACRTNFFQYISEEDVFDLLSLAQDLGYVRDGEEEFTFTAPGNTLQISLAEKAEENDQKFFKEIRYGKQSESIRCIFDRRDRNDGSTLYSVDTPDNFTVSMDQILLLTYIMENLNDETPDPLAGLYAAYYNAGTYRFPI